MGASSSEKQQAVEEMRKLLDWFVGDGALAAGVVVTYPNGDQLILESAAQLGFPLKVLSV